MSCESRQRTIINTLLTLAGLRDTVDPDTVTAVGVAHHHRYRRGGLPTTAAVSVSLHPDARHALEITGHSDQATPAWVAALVNRLYTAADRGSHRALLTLRWLIGGWEEVIPSLTWRDSAWLVAVTSMGISIPPVRRDRTATTRLAAVVGYLLSKPAREVVVLTETLDALGGIDDVPPEATQTVTPLQVLRFLLDEPFISRTELRQVLRAVLDGAPVVRETVAWAHTIGCRRTGSLPFALIECPAGARGSSVAQAGITVALGHVADRIRVATPCSIDLTALPDPSPEVVRTITDFIHNGWHRFLSPIDSAPFIALMRHWQTDGQYDAVEQVVRALEHALATNRDDSLTRWMVAMLIMTGVIRPPHGDTLVAHLVTASPRYGGRHEAWTALTAGATYAAMCQQAGCRLPVGGIDDLVRTQWSKDRFTDALSPIPVLAAGQARNLLLPELDTARGTAVWNVMILDCIDTMDVLDALGGDPQGIQAVLTDALTRESGLRDPQIIIRLAASRCGQAILDRLPTGGTPSVWVTSDRLWSARHIIPYLASPWWETAPPHLYAQWEHTIRLVAESTYANALNEPPPLYPTVWPRAAVIRPTEPLVQRAVANTQWATLPVADRQACLTSVVYAMGLDACIRAILHAATDMARHDIWHATVAAHVRSAKSQHAFRHLIDLDAWR